MVELCLNSQVVVYLDDILVLSTSFQECQKARNILLQILTSWNFQVAWDKSNLTPATCVRYLGWMWDLQRRTVAVPLDKWKKVKKTIRTHLRRRLLTWKSVASILGTINSLNLVMSHIRWHCTEAQLWLRLHQPADKQQWRQNLSATPCSTSSPSMDTRSGEDRTDKVPGQHQWTDQTVV